MGLLGRLRDHRKRDRIPTELFMPAPAFPAYQSEPLIPDFLPAPPITATPAPPTTATPAPPVTAPKRRNQRATGYDTRYGH
ncbi:hypothetical protein ODJ79_20995 [Actinoplanes sp. KI2]|uniref:hypothetical protein n=1 Tax=Actinoplanes sp. KI2 TaxID=2983315 RepID=UPI0021D5E26C|nr:hypothetical protein [Actinoplanes sp. KI2]MCU7726212.1 hypothetical protein [Actinoplanes sp. KI2]